MIATPRTDEILNQWSGHEDLDKRLAPLCHDLERQLYLATLELQSLHSIINRNRIAPYRYCGNKPLNETNPPRV